MAVASATRMEYFGGRDHIYFGWLMFGVVMMLIMWIGARFADDEEIGGTDLSGTMAIRASHSILPLIAALGLVMLAVTLAPLQADFGQTGAMIAAAAALLGFLFLLVRHTSGNEHPTTGRSKKTVFRFGWGRILAGIATLVILVLTPRFATTIENSAVDFVADLDLKRAVPCTFAGPWQKDWQPRFQNADLEQAMTFTCSGASVSVYVAAYASALQGKELISSAHQVVPPDWDRSSDSSSYAIRSQGGRDRSVDETRVDAEAYKAVIWYWYEVDGNVAAGSLMAKTYQVMALMRGQPAGGRVVVIETPAGTDIRRARERLESVAKAMMGAGSNVPPADAG
jgi:EpsI family protein